MLDLADNAQGAIELLAAEDERQARGKSIPESHPDFDGSTCLECGDLIPKERIKLGKIRCVWCQGLLERRKV